MFWTSKWEELGSMITVSMALLSYEIDMQLCMCKRYKTTNFTCIRVCGFRGENSGHQPYAAGDFTLRTTSWINHFSRGPPCLSSQNGVRDQELALGCSLLRGSSNCWWEKVKNMCDKTPAHVQCQPGSPPHTLTTRCTLWPPVLLESHCRL